MTDKVTVWPVFFAEPMEVDPDEAQALERGGLLRPGPVDSASPTPDTVMVTPVFTGRPMVMPADEAAGLDRAGLLVHEPEDEQPQAERHEESQAGLEPDEEQENE